MVPSKCLGMCEAWTRSCFTAEKKYYREVDKEKCEDSVRASILWKEEEEKAC
ncbi:MAG: hypothetical protein R3D26_13505 [Cyanobacteriota/Melainabacteria group bacterium]